MEKLKQRYNTTLKTLLTLDKAIKLLNDPKNEEYYDSFRDSVVQRFEYSIDIAVTEFDMNNNQLNLLAFENGVEYCKLSWSEWVYNN